MENNTTQTGGFWIMTEESTDDLLNDATETAEELQSMSKFKDTYQFYPDSSF